MSKKEIKIPSLGESITSCTIGRFLKENGAFVKEGEEIVELETDKVNQELYASSNGVISWQVKEGDNATINQVIGFIDMDATPPERSEVKKENALMPKSEEGPKEEKISKIEPSMKPQESPTTDGARYTKQAFLEDLETPPKETNHEEKGQKREGKQETRTKMSRIRQVIAKRLVDSLQTTAMLTTFNEVDMTQVMDLRARFKDSFMEKHKVKLGFMSFFVKAVVDALKVYPVLNSYIDKDEIVKREYFDIGIAVGGGQKGLVVPIVRQANELSFAEIEREIGNYAVKAKEGKLKIDDLQGGGFTITNGGIYGSLLSTPILNPPQSGILGMHQIQKRAVVVNDEIVIRPMMYLALSYDHRIVDGREAVSFLVHVKQVLEDPSRLILLPEESQ
jgi:2-oxoglutarate dehydrogenase E2 component (dihydrolipoamide succinyltransferase)